MSIRPVDEQKCPLDINICPFVHWTNRNIHWTYKCPFVHWTNGHCLMATTLVSYPHGVRLSQITSLQLPFTVNVTCPLDIQMSIRPLDKQKCPFDIQMSIRPVDEQKCPLDIQMSIRPVDQQKYPLDINICPFVHWTNRNVHWTSKCPYVHWTNGRMDTV